MSTCYVAPLSNIIGKYGVFWINYLKDTNYNFYIRLKNDTSAPLYKIAKEINRRIYILIHKIIELKTPHNIDNLSLNEQETTKKILFMQAEEAALNEIIYSK